MSERNVVEQTVPSVTGVRLRRLLWAGLPVLIVCGGFLVAGVLMRTAPKAERNVAPRQAQLVDVVEVAPSDVRVKIEAMGPVMPATEVGIKTQVGGEVVEISDELIPGGLFEAGEALVRIEPRDYELAVRQRESEVAAAERDLKLERGQQQIAKREYELLGEVIIEGDRELVLRMPQLESARVRVAAAAAALEDAKLDLERTRVVAPFNSFVRAKHVDRGEIVTPATGLVTLVGTDEFWVEVSLPVDDLRWIEIPRRGRDGGSPVRIYNEAAWGRGSHRIGSVVRLAGDLEPEGRMARLIVAVEDPMALAPANRDKPVMLIGAYVRAEVEGRRLQGVVALDRRLLHEGDVVRVLDDEDKLEIRTVEVAYRGRDQVLIGSGLKTGDRVVATDLPAPVSGMLLRVREVETAAAADDAAFVAEPERERARADDDTNNPG